MSMNIFRLVGDLSHLGAILLLLWKIWSTQSVAGISGKSQALLAVVFTCRYLDLFTHFVSLYNTTMKLIFLGSSWATVYMIFAKFKPTHDRIHDVFQPVAVVAPCAILALGVAIFTVGFDLMEILWIFSIYLESVAILPQLWMIQKTGEAETITSHYLAAMGSYRAFYILNWIYRYFYDNHCDWVAILAGIVQTVLYSDFLYLYVVKVAQGQTLRLPS